MLKPGAQQQPFVSATDVATNLFSSSDIPSHVMLGYLSDVVAINREISQIESAITPITEAVAAGAKFDCTTSSDSAECKC